VGKAVFGLLPFSPVPWRGQISTQQGGRKVSTKSALPVSLPEAARTAGCKPFGSILADVAGNLVNKVEEHHALWLTRLTSFAGVLERRVVLQTWVGEVRPREAFPDHGSWGA